MKHLLLLLLLIPSFSFAQDSGSYGGRQKVSNPETDFHFLLEPVLGYEFLKRSYPYDHTEGMFYYGARAVAGSQLIAGELLYTHGSANESFSNPDLTIQSSRDLVRLGARTMVPLERWIRLLVRAGEQASHDSYTITTASGSTDDSPKWEYHPYVGSGLIFHFIPELSLDVEGTYIFNGEYEFGFGFRIYI